VIHRILSNHALAYGKHFALHEKLRELCEALAEHHGLQTSNLQLNLQPCESEAYRLSPVAQILNEAVANSVQHSGRSLEELEINISLVADGDWITLEVEDNGTKKVDELRRVDGTGLALLQAFARQLGGNYLCDTESWKMTISWPNSSHTAHAGSGGYNR
jgi:two-component sensor histidine kinase